MRSLDWSYCERARTLGSLTDLELNSLVIVQRIAPTNLGMVDEQIFSATVLGDKAKALIAVEPFDGSLSHALNFLMLADLEEHTAASLPDDGLTLVRTVGSGVALLAAPLASQRAARPARRSGRIAHGRNKIPLDANISAASGLFWLVRLGAAYSFNPNLLNVGQEGVVCSHALRGGDQVWLAQSVSPAG
jgi:hypothetical protein